MTNLYTTIDEQVTQIQNAQSLDDVKMACESYCSAQELEFFLFGLCVATSLNSPQVSTLSNYPEGWFDRYFKDEMQKHDPVVKYCFENTAPIRWDSLVKNPQYTDAYGVSVMNSAAEVGLSHGLSVPIKSPTGAIAIFSMATSSRDHFEERANRALQTAYQFATAILDAVTRIRLALSEQDDPQETLTKRELDCLFWACEGKTAWEISKILGVTERTVIFHLSSATRKLGANNRQHAVAKAIMTGLIKPVI